MTTIALVSCAVTKLPTPAPARDLYVSDLFVKSRAWAERNADGWFILSAKHGLLAPDVVIEPYDVALDWMTERQRVRWGGRVAEQLQDALPPATHRVVVLAGRRYRDPLLGYLTQRVAYVDIPMAGLGIGEQRAWLGRAG